MCLRVELRPKSYLNDFIDMKNIVMKQYFNQKVDTNNNITTKSCPHELKSSSLSNFFLFLATLLMQLRDK